MAAVRREAMKIIDEGVATKDDINLAMTLGFGGQQGLSLRARTRDQAGSSF